VVYFGAFGVEFFDALAVRLGLVVGCGVELQPLFFGKIQ
jgi:hypothetical protein